MIAQARQGDPWVSVRRLCALLGVARRWYDEQPATPTRAEREVVFRGVIERIMCVRLAKHACRLRLRGGWTAVPAPPGR